MLLKEIHRIAHKLNSVMALLDAGAMERIGEDNIKAHDAIFTTLVDEKDYQAGNAIFAHRGDETPNHKHEGVTQYIIQYRGKTAAYFEGGGFRIVDVGQCVAIPPGMSHRFVAVTDDAEQFWVCIPAEPGYKIEA